MPSSFISQRPHFFFFRGVGGGGWGGGGLTKIVCKVVSDLFLKIYCSYYRTQQIILLLYHFTVYKYYIQFNSVMHCCKRCLYRLREGGGRSKWCFFDTQRVKCITIVVDDNEHEIQFGRSGGVELEPPTPPPPPQPPTQPSTHTLSPYYFCHFAANTPL